MSKHVVLMVMILFLVVLDFAVIYHPQVSSDAAFGTRDVKVLFDLTKDENAGNADWTINGAYSSWADNLTAMGYSVYQLSSYPITYGDSSNPMDLSNFAVYIIPEPQDNFTHSEEEAIREFVLNGGGLILISDHAGADRNDNGRDAVHIFNENLDTAQYGIIFNYDNVLNGSITDIDYSACPEITDGVHSVGIWNGATIRVEGNATALVFYNSSAPVVVNSTYGMGRIVAVGDSSPFDDGTGASGKNLYDGWDNCSDAKLGINIVNWVSGGAANGTAEVLPARGGSEPWVSYGDGDYLVSYSSGKATYGYFVNSSTGESGASFQIYRYGNGARSVYYPDMGEFAVISYDYDSSYHSVQCAFIKPDSTSVSRATVSNDANRSVALSYGNGKLLLVWVNLTRKQVEGEFYDGSFEGNFTIAVGSAMKFSVAAGYDTSTGKFLVVWTENYQIRGRYVDSSGPGDWVNFPAETGVKAAYLSVAGGHGAFMLTYRNGTLASTQGVYYFFITGSGITAGTADSHDASYTGAAFVSSTGSGFSVVYAMYDNGSSAIYLDNFSASGSKNAHELITAGSEKKETPAISMGGESSVVVWYDYSSGQVKGLYYQSGLYVPELSYIMLLLLPLLFWRRGNALQSPP